MPRNFQNRFELLFPVLNKEAKKKVLKVLKRQVRDDRNSFLLTPRERSASGEAATTPSTWSYEGGPPRPPQAPPRRRRGPARRAGRRAGPRPSPPGLEEGPPVEGELEAVGLGPDLPVRLVVVQVPAVPTR